MARIRTIKPEAPQSESLGRCRRDARLLFFMLFTIVDDDGRARAAPRMLASLLFPYDDDAKTHIVEWMFELEHEDAIILYSVDGVAYLQIRKWLDHQKIDRPSKSRLPPPPDKHREGVTKPRECASNNREPAATDLVSGTIDQEPKPGTASGDFDSFFAVFPKQEQRDNAEKAFADALAAGASPNELLTAAKNFAAFVEREKTQLKFVALAKNWLANGQWKDFLGKTAEIVLPPLHPSWPADVAKRWTKNLGEVMFRTYFGQAEYVEADPVRLCYRSKHLRRLAEEHCPQVAKEVSLELAA